MSKRLYIKFRYRDAASHWQWREQECVCDSVKECKDWYGLGIDCDYEIIEIKEVS